MRILPRMAALSLCALTLAACGGDTAEQEVDAEQTAEAAPAAPAASADAALAGYAGSWEAVAVMESGDTVPYTFTATADRDGWMATLPGRDAMPLRILTVDGDSVVTEMGPYDSLLREGVQVTVKQVARFTDGQVVGTMEAHYTGGEGDSVVRGEIEGSRTN